MSTESCLVKEIRERAIRQRTFPDLLHELEEGKMLIPQEDRESIMLILKGANILHSFMFSDYVDKIEKQLG